MTTANAGRICLHTALGAGSAAPAIAEKVVSDSDETVLTCANRIVGRNIEFVTDRKIVQQWYFGEESESIVTLKLHPDKSGTILEVGQTNIPDGDYENISEGWESDYIEGLKELFD